jgi:vancomycin resistance protein VanJ
MLNKVKQNSFLMAWIFIHCFFVLLPFITHPTFILLQFLIVAMPLFVMLNSFFLLLYLYKKQFLQAFVYFFVLLISLKLSGFAFTFTQSKKADFSAISYNVNQFGQQNSQAYAILDFLKKEKADFVFLQEFGLQFQWKKRDSIATLAATKMNKEYWHFAVDEHNIYGLGFFSNFPIIHSEILFLPTSKMNGCVYYEVAVNSNDTLAFYHFHLDSYNIAKCWNERSSFIDFLQAWGFNSKQSYLLKKEQLSKITVHASNKKHRIIFCGDANILPHTSLYKQMQDLGFDSFAEKGLGFGATFYSIFPLRVDYFIVNDNSKLQYIQVLQSNNSDHYPLRLGFDW